VVNTLVYRPTAMAEVTVGQVAGIIAFIFVVGKILDFQ
jgi:hypothetical protein